MFQEVVLRRTFFCLAALEGKVHLEHLQEESVARVKPMSWLSPFFFFRGTNSRSGLLRATHTHTNTHARALSQGRAVSTLPENGVKGGWRKKAGGGLSIEGYLTAHSLFNSVADEERELREPARDLDTIRMTVFVSSIFLRRPLALCWRIY